MLSILSNNLSVRQCFTNIVFVCFFVVFYWFDDDLVWSKQISLSFFAEKYRPQN